MFYFVSFHFFNFFPLLFSLLFSSLHKIFRSLFTPHHLLFTFFHRRSLFTAHCSLLTVCCLFLTLLLPLPAYSAQVTLQWDPNTEPELAGYKVYVGIESGNYEYFIDAGNKTTLTVPNLRDGETYYFAATAYDSSDFESDFSNEVVYNFPAPCSYSFSSTSQFFDSSGGTGTVNVTSQSDCTWTVTSSASWLMITSNSSNTGSRTVYYSVLANPNASPRTGTLGIAGKAFTVTQEGIASFNLMVNKSGTGAGTVSVNPPGTSYKAGNAVTLTAAPDAGSTFSGWTGACTGTLPTCSLTITAPTSVTAFFALNTYTITAKAGPNGSISPQGSITVRHGGNQNFTIAPNSGYRVADVKVDGPSIGAVGSYSFANLSSDHTIEASFAPAEATNLLVNGGFESGNLANWEYARGMSVESQSAYSGSFGVKMVGNGRIDHRFSTIVGKTYFVSARIRIDRQIKAARSGGLMVQIWDNANRKKSRLLAASPYLTAQNSLVGQWTKINLSFVATTTQSRIVFQNSGNGRFEASADDFIVTPQTSMRFDL